MTMLLVDAGNTRVKWAIAHAGAAPGEWIAHGAVVHAELDSLTAAWAGRGVSRAVVSNVAGSAIRERLSALLPLSEPEWFGAQPALAGLRNRYRNPTQLGADRFAAALGARALAPGQALVVATCGTATTVDGVSADGDFVGGMILPGLGLMLSSLARGTAQLPLPPCRRRCASSPAARPATWPRRCRCRTGCWIISCWSACMRPPSPPLHHRETPC
jgi:type III pantothenate kinase